MGEENTREYKRFSVLKYENKTLRDLPENKRFLINSKFIIILLKGFELTFNTTILYWVITQT